MKKPGYYKGKHYTEYVEDIKRLKREGSKDTVESLLLMLVDATEEEDRYEKMGVAPWFYHELAILYRKEGRYSDEVDILERYERQRKAPGVMPA
ncbi:MAG: hypothetical protein PHP64_05740, partial [Actinomycetota bacterium]|nr:hypothetical protein [Actinomycetota bacterium]